MRSLLQDWKKWSFHLMHRIQHREGSKMKKQRHMFKMKKQDKISRKKKLFYEIGVIYLISVQSNGYKYIHRTQMDEHTS